MEQFTANDKKPLFDSDIDPKRIKSVADGLRRQGEFESARMLDGYADLLEAREMAVPVWQFRVVPKGSTWTDVKDDEIWTAVTAHPESYEPRVLYTHSAQAQPPAASATKRERKGHTEWRQGSEKDGGGTTNYVEPVWVWDEPEQTAASVTDAMVSRAWMALTGRAGKRGYENDFECMMEVERKAVRAALEAALAAQENPNG